MKPTIFITSFHALISRNILMSGVAAQLAKRARVVLLVPKEKAAYFEEEYGGEGIVVEGVATTLTRADRFLRSLILAISHTKGLSIKKRAAYEADGRLLAYLLAIVPSVLLRGARPVVALARALDPYVLRSHRFVALFEKYRPSEIFSTDPQNEMDVRLIEEAKARGVPTVAMIRSWDNVSSKGLLRALPARVLVHNESLARQVVHQNFVRESSVTVVGIPHYDRYIRREGVSAREAFFSAMGLDPSKKLVLLAPIGDRYIRDNRLDALILATLAELEVNVLVRLPPMDTIAYLPVPNKKAHVVIQKTGDRPWKSARGTGASKLNEITRADEQTLVDSLAYADVLVTGQSTMVIDAAAFDLPSVIVEFDTEARPYYDSMRRYYDYEYYPPVIKSGGVFVARAAQELATLVERSLEDRALGKEGRARLLREQCGFTDGNSTERVVAALSAYHE